MRGLILKIELRKEPSRQNTQCKGPEVEASLASSRKRGRQVWLKGTDQGGGEVMRAGIVFSVHSHILSFGRESTGVVTQQQKHRAASFSQHPFPGQICRSLCLMELSLKLHFLGGKFLKYSSKHILLLLFYKIHM